MLELNAHASSKTGAAACRGAEKAAVKETDGWVNEGVRLLVDLVVGLDKEQEAAGALPSSSSASADRNEAYRSDPSYAEWYQRHGPQYEQFYGVSMPQPLPAAQEAQRQLPPPLQARPAAPPPRQQPRALPPPQSTPYSAAIEPQQPVRRRQLVRQAAPAPDPPPQQQAAWPPQQRQPGGMNSNAPSGLLLEVQRRPLPREQQQAAMPPPAVSGAWMPPAQQQLTPQPQPAAAAPTLQQQQQQPPPQQQQPSPPGRSFREAVQLSVVQPEVLPN